MGPKIGKVLKKNLFAIVTLTLTVAVLFYFLVITDGFGTIRRIAANLKPDWVVLTLLTVAGCWLMEGFVLHLLCLHLSPGWSYARSLTVGMTGLLYSALSPFGSAGQPMQIYSMHKMGMDTGKAGSIIAVKTLTYQVVMVAYSLVAVAAKLRFFQSSVSNFSFVTILGLLANSTYIALIFLFMASETVTDKIVRGTLRFLHRIRLVRRPEERYAKIHGQLEIFHTASKQMGRSTRLYLLTMALSALQVTANSLMPYLIYRSFGLRGESPSTMIAAQVFVTTIASFVPLPGASGGAEGSFALFFGMFFQSAILPALLFWRFLTYYVNILFGGVIAYIGGKVFVRSDEEEEEPTE